MEKGSQASKGGGRTARQGSGRASGEAVIQIRLTDLHPFPDHPFKVQEDESMRETAESVKEFGVLTPAIVRPREGGGYEMISGHRRKHACELAGMETMPAIVRDMDDAMATITMVDSNLQRENILPSERAQAYKMKMEALKRRAGRPSRDDRENGGQDGHNLRGVKSRDLVAAGADESARTIQRYIRLTELSPDLLQMVDDRKIALTPAVEISYLKPEEQALLVETIESEQATPSLSQAQRMRQLSKMGALDEDTMLAVMSEVKKPEKYDITISGDKLQKYFPRSYTPRQMEETILKLLEAWQRRRQQNQQR